MNRQTFNYERARAKYLIGRGQNVEYWSGYCAGLEQLVGEADTTDNGHTAEWKAGKADALALAVRSRGRPRGEEQSGVFSIRLPKSVIRTLDKKKRKNIKKNIIDDLKEGE